MWTSQCTHLKDTYARNFITSVHSHVSLRHGYNYHASLRFLLESTVPMNVIPQNLHTRPKTFHNITLPQYIRWANAGYEILLPGFWITTRHIGMNGKKALYGLHICKVMELNPTRCFLVRKRRKDFERFFIYLTSVSTPDKVCFSSAIYLDSVLFILEILALDQSKGSFGWR
jgi:hypothetical protein